MYLLSSSLGSSSAYTVRQNRGFCSSLFRLSDHTRSPSTSRHPSASASMAEERKTSRSIAPTDSRSDGRQSEHKSGEPARGEAEAETRRGRAAAESLDKTLSSSSSESSKGNECAAELEEEVHETSKRHRTVAKKGRSISRSPVPSLHDNAGGQSQTSGVESHRQSDVRSDQSSTSSSANGARTTLTGTGQHRRGSAHASSTTSGRSTSGRQATQTLHAEIGGSDIIVYHGMRRADTSGKENAAPAQTDQNRIPFPLSDTASQTSTESMGRGSSPTSVFGLERPPVTLHSRKRARKKRGRPSKLARMGLDATGLAVTPQPKRKRPIEKRPRRLTTPDCNHGSTRKKRRHMSRNDSAELRENIFQRFGGSSVEKKARTKRRTGARKNVTKKSGSRSSSSSSSNSVSTQGSQCSQNSTADMLNQSDMVPRAVPKPQASVMTQNQATPMRTEYSSPFKQWIPWSLSSMSKHQQCAFFFRLLFCFGY